VKEVPTAPVQQSGYSQQMVTCADTTGQAFAIWLNVSYLPSPSAPAARNASFFNQEIEPASAVAEAAAEAALVWLKKLAFRAAGAEGLAENVGTSFTAAPVQQSGYSQQTSLGGGRGGGGSGVSQLLQRGATGRVGDSVVDK
jgi:hypothetical protein